MTITFMIRLITLFFNREAHFEDSGAVLTFGCEFFAYHDSAVSEGRCPKPFQLLLPAYTGKFGYGMKKLTKGFNALLS